MAQGQLVPDEKPLPGARGNRAAGGDAAVEEIAVGDPTSTIGPMVSCSMS